MLKDGVEALVTVTLSKKSNKDLASLNIKYATNGTGADGYDFSFEFQKPLDENTTGDFFDLSIPMPDYVPNGMINVSNINGALSFENKSWLNTEVVSTGSTDYEGRIGSDIVDPSINSLTYSQGTRDYPSIIIDGNITDDINLDYVAFEIKWPKTNGYNQLIPVLHFLSITMIRFQN